MLTGLARSNRQDVTCKRTEDFNFCAPSRINPDETVVPTVERRLATSRYDCVVIGAGVRLPPSRLVLFEALVDAIHRAAPSAAIAFNTRPEDTGAAAAR